MELPIVNTTLDEYKVSLQGTLGKLFQGRMIHGWQTIGRRKNDEYEYKAEFLYLNDYKFSEKWSMMNMFVLGEQLLAKKGILLAYRIITSFINIIDIIARGRIEQLNINKYQFRLTPQIQYAFSKNASIKFGGGLSTLERREKTEWSVISRFIYDF